MNNILAALIDAILFACGGGFLCVLPMLLMRTRAQQRKWFRVVIVVATLSGVTGFIMGYASSSQSSDGMEAEL